MMFRSTGIITVKIIGAYKEQFLSELFSEHFRVRNIREDHGIIYAEVRRRNYKKISAVSRKYGVMIRVCGKNRLYISINRYKRRYGIIVGLLSACFMLLILRQYVWRIDVHGNYGFTENYLLEQLEKNGFKPGVYTADVDTTEIERTVSIENDGISWMNLEINGSRADLYISESNIPKKEGLSLKTPCNVISSHRAVIAETKVYAGELLFKEGDEIGEGTVIVSGTVNDGSGNIIYTHANADIIGEFFQETDFYQPFCSTEKILNGNEEVQKQLMLLGIAIPLYIIPIDTENKICEEEIKNASFFGIELPWSIKTETYKQYSNVDVARTKSDAEKQLLLQFEEYCREIYRNYEILEKGTQFEYDENGVTLHTAVKLRGNIAAYQPIWVKE